MFNTTCKILAIALLSLFLSCNTQKVALINGGSGCWKEQYGTEQCGIAQKYNGKDSTYTMRTFDGWTMVVKSERIVWKYPDAKTVLDAYDVFVDSANKAALKKFEEK